jgi:hypothetical protein
MVRIAAGRAVEVLWLDANGKDEGWRDVSTIDHSPVEVRTVGILLQQNEDGITVALSTTHDRSVAGGYIFIPHPYVVKVRALR